MRCEPTDNYIILIIKLRMEIENSDLNKTKKKKGTKSIVSSIK